MKVVWFSYYKLPEDKALCLLFRFFLASLSADFVFFYIAVFTDVSCLMFIHIIP